MPPPRWHGDAAGLRADIGAALRFLPPYSPDFNPIEMAFSKFKAYLKRRATRSVAELREAIGQATDNFTPAECQSDFAAAGYDRERSESALAASHSTALSRYAHR